ncbi:MAG: L,D-transpeptidase [Verrucomicrobiales bacterium]|nr:L,D-transpeptidase [Verrucomicrobiales bacterium]
MSSAVLSTSVIRLLAPVSSLPSEGEEELPEFCADQSAGSLMRVLGWYQHLAAPGAVRLRLNGLELEWPQEPEAPLAILELEESEEGLSMEDSPAGVEISWAAVAEAYARRTDDSHFLGGPVEAQRVLLEVIREEARETARFFEGDALPLIGKRDLGNGTVEFAFLGIWLNLEEKDGFTGSLSRSLSSQCWDGVGNQQGTLLILEDPEAEGHGIRGAAASLSLLAVVFTAPAAQAGLFGFGGNKPPAAVTHESKATVDGTPLLVKSQKLVQAAPKIYPSGLAGQDQDAPRKVVVDIKAQRAYLFVGGKLAFETPVSTASKGRTTPRGTFNITEKIRSGKRSTIYKSAMPYWNRLDETAIGMHTGQLPGYPASHGCIRLPDESARFIFDNASRGTTVQIVDALAAAPVPTPAAPAAPAPASGLLAAAGG